MTKYSNSFPHQRSININKETFDKEKLYTKINIEAMNNAMRDLKPNTYKLWCYFAQNKNQYTFWLSAVDVHNTTGMSESSYHRAFDELVDKFYLIKSMEDRKNYDFYEVPHDHGKHNVKITINKK